MRGWNRIEERLASAEAAPTPGGVSTSDHLVKWGVMSVARGCSPAFRRPEEAVKNLRSDPRRRSSNDRQLYDFSQALKACATTPVKPTAAVAGSLALLARHV